MKSSHKKRSAIVTKTSGMHWIFALVVCTVMRLAVTDGLPVDGTAFRGLLTSDEGQMANGKGGSKLVEVLSRLEDMLSVLPEKDRYDLEALLEEILEELQLGHENQLHEHQSQQYHSSSVDKDIDGINTPEGSNVQETSKDVKNSKSCTHYDGSESQKRPELGQLEAEVQRLEHQYNEIISDGEGNMAMEDSGATGANAQQDSNKEDVVNCSSDDSSELHQSQNNYEHGGEIPKLKEALFTESKSDDDDDEYGGDNDDRDIEQILKLVAKYTRNPSVATSQREMTEESLDRADQAVQLEKSSPGAGEYNSDLKNTDRHHCDGREAQSRSDCKGNALDGSGTSITGFKDTVELERILQLFARYTRNPPGVVYSRALRSKNPDSSRDKSKIPSTLNGHKGSVADHAMGEEQAEVSSDENGKESDGVNMNISKLIARLLRS